MPELGTYTVTILLKAQEQVSGAVRRATNAMKEMERQASGLRWALSEIGKVAAGVVSGLVGFEALHRVVDFMKEGIVMFAELEKSMRVLAVVSQEAGQDIGNLSRKYMEAASRAADKFGLSVMDTSRALDSLVRAGLSGADAIFQFSF